MDAAQNQRLIARQSVTPVKTALPALEPAEFGRAGSRLSSPVAKRSRMAPSTFVLTFRNALTVFGHVTGQPAAPTAAGEGNRPGLPRGDGRSPRALAGRFVGPIEPRRATGGCDASKRPQCL